MTTSAPLPLRWLLIFWIFVISAIAYLDRVNISIAAQFIAHDFRLSNQQLGLVFSAFQLGYGLFQAPAGRLADRLGARLVLVLGVIWWAVFTVVITVLPPVMSGALLLVVAARFSLGLGEAVLYPASNCVVSAWIPNVERGRANGLIFAGVGFGAGVTSPLVTYVMVNYGWRSAFWLSAALGLAAGLVWYVLARDRPSQHPNISAAELRTIEDGLPPAVRQPSAKIPWRQVLANRNILTVTLSYFSFGYAAQIFFSWFFLYLSRVRGLDLKQSAWYTTLPFIAMSIGSIVGGIVSDRLTRRWGKRVGRCGLAAVGIGLCAVFLAFGTQAATGQMASIILAGGAGALYLSQSSFWSVSADIGGKSSGSVSGFMNMGGQIGGAVTASATPAIADAYGWTAAFMVAAIICVLGALAWLTIDGAGQRTSSL